MGNLCSGEGEERELILKGWDLNGGGEGNKEENLLHL